MLFGFSEDEFQMLLTFFASLLLIISPSQGTLSDIMLEYLFSRDALGYFVSLDEIGLKAQESKICK